MEGREEPTVLRKLGEPCPRCKRPNALEVYGTRRESVLRCEFCGWVED